MKTIINISKIALGLFLISTLNANANSNEPPKKKKSKIETEAMIIKTPLEVNEEYVTAVYNNSSQTEATYLSGVIAQWDARESSKFDSRNKPFTTVFKSNKGFAEVTYNNNGEVLAAEKRFKNVTLPTQISKLVAKRYEDWVIVQNKYSVSYEQGKEVEKTYVLTLRKGKEKKTVKVNG